MDLKLSSKFYFMTSDNTDYTFAHGSSASYIDALPSDIDILLSAHDAEPALLEVGEANVPLDYE